MSLHLPASVKDPLQKLEAHTLDDYASVELDRTAPAE
jgi:hypothetical protein